MDLRNITTQLKDIYYKAIAYLQPYWEAIKPKILKIARPLYFPSDHPNRKTRWAINIGKVLGHLVFLLAVLILSVYTAYSDIFLLKPNLSRSLHLMLPPYSPLTTFSSDASIGKTVLA